MAGTEGSVKQDKKRYSLLKEIIQKLVDERVQMMNAVGVSLTKNEIQMIIDEEIKYNLPESILNYDELASGISIESVHSDLIFDTLANYA